MRKRSGTFLSSLFAIMLIAAASLSLVACSSEGNGETLSHNEISVTPVDIGEGDTTFSFVAIMLDGTQKAYIVSTDQTTVGAALEEVGLISGSEDDFGVYVDTVCGEYHKYTEDGKYWAFYIDGQYAMTGVDDTEIEENKAYCFKAE